MWLMTTQKQLDLAQVCERQCKNDIYLPSPEALLERHAVLQSPSRIEELVKIFIHATNVRFLWHLLYCPRLNCF
jgi:hypothetical protein